MSRRKTTFYRDRDRDHYLIATGESPQGMAGIVAIVWEGETPNKLAETVKPVPDLQLLEQVESSDVPAEWWQAFVDAKLVKARPPAKPPKPPKQPKPKKEPKQPEQPEQPAGFVSPLEPGAFLVFAFWALVIYFCAS